MRASIAVGISGLLCLRSMLLAAPAQAPAQVPALGDLSKVGRVEFPTSCKAEVQPEFLRGVALLHSFFYGEARRVFDTVAEKDPSCAMAYWGEAMTWFHPIWAAPNGDEMKAGLAAVSKAEAAGAKTEREREYIASIAAYYRAPESATGSVGQTCHGPTAQESRRAVYRDALKRLHEKYPEDDEAAAFYALSLIKSSPLKDDLPVQLEAARILEDLWRKNRDHPGVVHYLIHAYDYPTLAKQGVPAADHYAKIAPWVPHALHMPSHIYTRLGMWDQSIRSNAASAAAARAYGAAHYPGATYFEELHALDYLVYAQLQRGEDAKARAGVIQVNAITKTYPEADFVVAYALSAIPARDALERHAWKEAAALKPAEQLLERFPFARGQVEFARALGALRGGDLPAAREALERLKARRDETTDPRFAFFRRQLEIQHLAIGGLLAQTEGRTDEAIALVRYAADEDDALGKNPVSPGNLYPVREILGELMLDLNRPAEAQAAFERSLELNPGRFRALAGAARSAEAAGRREDARAYYGRLVDLARAGDGTRPEITRARSYLANPDVTRTTKAPG
jgi:tetratricopeptide (TPR) repeat protein